MNSSRIGRKRVLVVDDQPEVREIVRLLLEMDKHKVTEARSGAEALERLETTSFDLVMTDLAMPGMRGDDLAVAIKKRKPSQLILLMTGSAGVAEEDCDGIDGFIQKPFMLDQLQEALAVCFARLAPKLAA